MGNNNSYNKKIVKDKCLYNNKLYFDLSKKILDKNNNLVKKDSLCLNLKCSRSFVKDEVLSSEILSKRRINLITYNIIRKLLLNNKDSSSIISRNNYILNNFILVLKNNINNIASYNNVVEFSKFINDNISIFNILNITTSDLITQEITSKNIYSKSGMNSKNISNRSLLSNYNHLIKDKESKHISRNNKYIYKNYNVKNNKDTLYSNISNNKLTDLKNKYNNKFLNTITLNKSTDNINDSNYINNINISKIKHNNYNTNIINKSIDSRSDNSFIRAFSYGKSIFKRKSLSPLIPFKKKNDPNKVPTYNYVFNPKKAKENKDEFISKLKSVKENNINKINVTNNYNTIINNNYTVNKKDNNSLENNTNNINNDILHSNRYKHASYVEILKRKKEIMLNKPYIKINTDDNSNSNNNVSTSKKKDYNKNNNSTIKTNILKKEKDVSNRKVITKKLNDNCDNLKEDLIAINKKRLEKFFNENQKVNRNINNIDNTSLKNNQIIPVVNSKDNKNLNDVNIIDIDNKYNDIQLSYLRKSPSFSNLEKEEKSNVYNKAKILNAVYKKNNNNVNNNNNNNNYDRKPSDIILAERMSFNPNYVVKKISNNSSNKTNKLTSNNNNNNNTITNKIYVKKKAHVPEKKDYSINSYNNNNNNNNNRDTFGLNNFELNNNLNEINNECNLAESEYFSTCKFIRDI